MLKETFKMRKIGKHLVNVSMLSLAIAPVVGSALAPTTVFAAEYKSGQNGSNKLEFTTKSSTSSTSTKTHEPMDLIQIIDLSGSLSDGEYKQRNGVTGARKQQINDMIYVIEHQLTDQDRVMLAFYGTNKENSYVVGGQDGGLATKLMSKKEAIDLLNKINAEKQVHDVAQSWTLIPQVVKPLLGNYIASDAQDGTGFEDVYKAQPNKNKVVSVLQFTDNWTLNEKENIDVSFADWAKTTAKTFMTVVDDSDPDSALSVAQMKKAGHPNIKVFKSLNAPGRSEEIAKLFESTATVTKTTTIKQRTHVSITPEDGVTLAKASLVSADGKTTDLKIEGNKVSADLNDLADGKYTVNYSFKGDVKSIKKITSSVSVDGKEVDKKEDTISPVVPPVAPAKPAEPKVTKRTEKIPFKTETKEDPTLPEGEKKVIQKGAEGEKEIVTTQESTTIKSRKPADVVVILDGSTSMSGNYLKSLRAAQALVNSLTDNDRVIVAMYTANTAESYISGNNGYQGGTTVAMTKAEALDGINKLMAGNPRNARGDLNDFLGAFETKRDPSLQIEQIGATSLREPKFGTKTPMEELIQKQRRANTTLSIAQFTDGWEDQETIDTSFVDYAKKNAKTFMSIVFPTGGDLKAPNAFGSVAKMTVAGHPNVYKAIDDSKVAEDVVKQFENTAIDVVKGDPVTTENIIKQPVNEIIHIGTKGAKSEVTEKKVPFETIKKDDPTLEEGQEKVIQEGVAGVIKVTTTYDTQKGQKVEGSEKVTEKETVKKVDKIIAVGTKGSKSEVTEKKVPFETIKKDDPTLEEGREKVVQEGVEGVIKVTTTYETQKGEKVKGSEKVTEEKVTDKVDKIIAVGTKGSKSEVTEKKVPFETIYKQDPTLKKGEEKVLQEGVEGVIKVTTTYETQKGKKVDGSEKVTEETVTEKVDKIVAQGTMEKRKVRYRVVDSKGQELVKQTDVMEAYQDEEYKVETPKLDGYRLELAKDSVPATGKVADRDVLVTFVAVKIGKPVTLKFIDESGSEIAQKKVLTGENAEVDTEFTGEAPETIEKDGVKYAFVGIKQTGSKERKVSGKVTDQEQVIEAVYAKPKELPKTSEQAKQRNTAIIALLSVVGLGGLATYLGLRKRDEK